MPPDLARIAVIMTGEDTLSTAERSIESVIRNTSAEADLTVVLPPVPGFVDRAIERLMALRPFRLVRVPEWQPQHAQRNQGLAGLPPKDYYAFVDLDSIVPPGWLEKLLGHAQALKGDLVSPLILVNEDTPGTVHMAGGRVVFRPDADGRPGMDQFHDWPNADLTAAMAALPDAPFDTGLVEYHCLLVSARAMAWLGTLDERLEGCMEHVDTCVIVARAGGRIVLCPDIRVTLLDEANLVVADLPAYTATWDTAASARKLAYFGAKYGLPAAGEYVLYQRAWNGRHLETIGTVRRPVPEPPPLAGLVRHGYAQTWPQLVCQLAALGWSGAEMTAAKTCHAMAQVQFDGLYRASGKSFLAHLVGTASILASHGAPPLMVEAALLHAGYTEGRLAEAQKDYAPPALRRWLAERIGADVENLVYDYGRQRWAETPAPRNRDEVDAYPLSRARSLVIKAANDIEERLDFAPCLSAKTPAHGAAARAHAEAVLGALGFGGLLRDLIAAEHLAAAAEAAPVLPETLRDDGVGSYPIARLDALRYTPPAAAQPAGWLARLMPKMRRAS